MASKRLRDAVGIDPDRVVSAAVNAVLGDTPAHQKKHHPGRVLAAGAALAAAAAVGQRRMPRLAKEPLRMGLHKLGDMTHVDELADALRDRLVGHDDEPEDDYYDDEDLDGEDLDEEEEFDDEPRDEAEDLPEDEDEDGDEGFDDEDDEGFDDEPEDDDGPRGEGDEEPEDEEPEEDLEDEPDDAQPEDEEPEDEEPEDDEDLEDEEDLEPEDDEELEPEDDDEQIAARSVDLGVPHDTNGRRGRDRVPDLFAALRTPHRRPPVMRRGSLRVDPASRPPQPDESRSRDERLGRSKKPKSKAARA
jgi:hypothetical protein